MTQTPSELNSKTELENPGIDDHGLGSMTLGLAHLTSSTNQDEAGLSVRIEFALQQEPLGQITECVGRGGGRTQKAKLGGYDTDPAQGAQQRGRRWGVLPACHMTLDTGFKVV